MEKNCLTENSSLIIHKGTKQNNIIATKCKGPHIWYSLHSGSVVFRVTKAGL